MKISSIKQQIKNPERVSVFVANKYEFSLSLDELVKYKLKNGDELTAGDVKKYKKISADGKLRARALEWLMNRPHSEREFRDYMYRKKADPDQVDGLVGEFTDKGYLDNAKFAVWFSELQSRRGKSDRAIRSDLFKKGISGEAAGQAVTQSAGREADRLKAVIEKKQRLSRYKDNPQKLATYLVGQGYSWQDVKAALAIDKTED